MTALDVERYRVRRSDVTSAVFVIAHFALVFAPVYLAAALGSHPVVPLLWLWFGTTQNGLINLLHESAHGLTFKSKTATRILGRSVLGPLVLSDFDGYRERHWQHHRRIGTADDPKKAYREDIRGVRIFWLFLRCMSMIEGVRLLKAGRSGEPKPTGVVLLSLARVALAQSLLLASVASVALVFHPTPLSAFIAVLVAYGFVYGHGLGALTVFVAALRAIAEHQIGSDASATEGDAALRNFHCRGLSRLVFGAYGFGEHATHHLEPSIPHYNLVSATEELGRSEDSYCPRSTYVETLLMLMDPARSPSRTATERTS